MGADQSGSVLAAQHASIAEPYSYSAYGEAPSQAASSVLGYTGQYRDPVVPGYRLGNGYRTYLPALMRFGQPDAPGYSPFGRGGINSYGYCHSDPINRLDPSGHFDLFGFFNGFANTWKTIWKDIGDDLDRMDPFKLFNKQVTAPAVKWFMHQKWARSTPVYWGLYGLGKGYQKLNPDERQMFGEVGRLGEVLPFIPGVGELGEVDDIVDGVMEGTTEGLGDMTGGSSDVVTTGGRFEGAPEPAPNFREAPPEDEPNPLNPREEEGQILDLQDQWDEFMQRYLVDGMEGFNAFDLARRQAGLQPEVIEGGQLPIPDEDIPGELLRPRRDSEASDDSDGSWAPRPNRLDLNLDDE
jgi:RHS repeat-associated protein